MEGFRPGWSFFIDRGGTFTDVIARAPDGAVRAFKLLSEDPDAYDDAALAGMRLAIGLPPGAPIPSHAVETLRMGTTVATNALLERKGARTVLVCTRGFEDLPLIGDQSRPELFALDVRRARPLAERVLGIAGRVAADGTEVAPLDEAAVRAVLVRARADGFESCAVALLHGWVHPGHERRVAAIAAGCGFREITASHECDPHPRLVPRTRTTVADAYLNPVLRAHVERLRRALPGVPVHLMQSHGGLVRAERFRARDAILSGPAGGVIGAARVVRATGVSRVACFDMGGTSTDVSIVDGEPTLTTEAVLGGQTVRAPTVAIETVAAGGGSIVRFDGERLRVGPDSAGADPGPACYRKGGPATITDANVVLGRVRPERFPRIFGAGRDQPLDPDASRRAFAILAQAMTAGGAATGPEQLAAGAVRVAVAAMANAVRRIGTARGHDLGRFALCCYGGAGGQHACSVADELEIGHVVIHRRAGLLSAFGMALADRTVRREQAVERPLAAAAADLPALLDALERDARAVLAEDGDPEGTIEVRAEAILGYGDTETAFTLPAGDEAAMRDAFEAAHRDRFGFVLPDRVVLMRAAAVAATVPGAAPAERWEPDGTTGPVPAGEPVRVMAWDGCRMAALPLHDRDELRPEASVHGPALVAEAHGCTVVETGWSATVDGNGSLHLRRTGAREAAATGTPATDADTGAGNGMGGGAAEADPVRLALFAAGFAAVAEEMGEVLRATASSVNIRERLDFSCAVFDATGALVANAPHVPVHLGAMGESVRHVIDKRGDTLKPGDGVVLNDPFAGGTHLPDVTLVTPVFDGNGRLRCFLGSRGHHVDVGGITPGSVPPFSTRLDEEGVVLDDLLVFEGGGFREDAFRRALAAGPFPARAPDVNVADLLAQAAANRRGVREMERLAARVGWDTMERFFEHVMGNAERAVRRLLGRLRDGEREYRLDDGAVLRVAVRIEGNDDGGGSDRRRAVIDFAGTDGQRPGNFNAPPAVVRASVLYVLRCLLDDDLPLNDGCLRPVRIRVPDGSFLRPRPGAAVVSGNTELSQAVAAALFGALGACASGQATMNNLTLGDGARQYYETIGGGTGAGPGTDGTGFDGADAVQNHMTNTRMTDPEIMEMRLPVRVEGFAIREGSGGDGRRRGGNGIRRELRFLQPMRAMLVSSRRTVAPFGLDGGADGATGRQWVDTVDGVRVALPGVCGREMAAGDVLVVETPGGGGWGSPGNRSGSGSDPAG